MLRCGGCRRGSIFDVVVGKLQCAIRLNCKIEYLSDVDVDV